MTPATGDPMAGADNHRALDGAYALLVVGAAGCFYASQYPPAEGASGGPWPPPVLGVPLAFALVWALTATRGPTGRDRRGLVVAVLVLVLQALLWSSTWGALASWSWAVPLLGPSVVGLAVLGWRQDGRAVAPWAVALAVVVAVSDALQHTTATVGDGIVSWRMVVAQAGFAAAAVAGAVRIVRARAESAGA